MKCLYFGFLVFLSTTAFSQDEKRNIIGVGVGFYTVSSDDVGLEGSTIQTVFLEYDWIHPKSWGFGLEAHVSTSDTPGFMSIALKLGFVINNEERLQFPIAGSAGFFSLTDASVYGTAMLGLKGGIRFYLTNNLSLQGMYNFNRLTITKIDDTRFEDESFGSFRHMGPTLSLQYYFSRG